MNAKCNEPALGQSVQTHSVHSITDRDRTRGRLPFDLTLSSPNSDDGRSDLETDELGVSELIYTGL